MITHEPMISSHQGESASCVLLYRKGPLRVAEMWFAPASVPSNVDIVRYFQFGQPPPGVIAEDFPTVIVDLEPSPEKLFSALKKESRYEVRRATEKDNLALFSPQNDAVNNALVRFRKFFKQFARDRGLPDETSRLERLAAAKALWLSESRDQNGESLTWHAYLVTPDRARLLHSCSSYRNAEPARKALVGRANRFHHWEDMLALRALGIRRYDFGGWYPGQSDQQRLRINKFKEEFGGSVVVNFNAVHAVSLRGRSAIAVRNLWSRLRSMREAETVDHG